MLFPKENDFDFAFLSASQGSGVPLSVLKGFAALESAFDPKSYRYEPHIDDASYGLMQTLYKTAKAEGYRDQPEGLFDPATSTKYGALFLAKLLKKYPVLSDAVASYNMGFPRSAERTTPLIKKLYGEPKPGWKYANQPYVDRVLAYIAYYQALENADRAAAAEIEDLLKKKDWPTLRVASGRFISLVQEIVSVMLPSAS